MKDAMHIADLPFRLITWLICLVLVVIALPLVIYLCTYDALDVACVA